MARKSKRPASRGSVNNIILKVLSTKDMYGYDIIKEVENATDGKVVLKQPSLYSSLSRFETKGFVSSYWEDSAIGGRRHYYSLTPSGREYYQRVVNKNNSDSDEMNTEDDIEEIVEDEDSEIEDIANSEELEEYEIDKDEPSKNISDYKFDLKNKVDELLQENDIETSEPNDDEIHDEDLHEEKRVVKPVVYQKITRPSSEQTVKVDSEIEDIIENDEPETNQYSKEDIKTAREQLNEIYNSIVKNKNKSPQSTKGLFPKEENTKPTPLTLLEQQKRKESMEILYGNKSDEIKPYQFEPKQKLFQEETNNVVETNDYKKLIEIVDKKNSENETKVQQNRTTDEQVKPKKKFVVDEFGIMKIAEDLPVQKEQKIFDNVGFRTNNTGHNVVEYREPSSKPVVRSDEVKNQPGEFETGKMSDVLDMTDEERAERQERFNKRFENLQKEKIEQRKSDNVDLKNILGDLYYNDNDKPHSTFHNKNARLFANTDEEFDKSNIEENQINNEEKQETVTLNPNIKLEDNSILNIQKELINKGVEFNTYSSNVKTKRDTDFFLVNKLKMVLGFILMSLMIIETTVFLLITKKYLMYSDSNKSIFIAAYVLSVVVPLLMILPCIFSPNKRKLNNFRLSYSVLFGIFGFILICILTYAVNTLFGFTLENVEYYLTSLIMPALLSINFIIMPFFYKLLLNSKRFY